MEKKTSKEWLEEEQKRIGLEIIEPDGWDRENMSYSFGEEKITKWEWEERLMKSTIRATIKPENHVPIPEVLPDINKIDNGEGDEIPIADIRSQGGLKKDIVDLVIKMPAPDRSCELTDFLGALQYVLDKHKVRI